MRKILIALLASTAVLSTGCEKIFGGDWIVDWAPVNVYIEASDTDGNSIISPDMPGMTLTFKGETYTVKGIENQGEAQTKAYKATMEGLIAQPLMEVNGKTVYRLVFGEIDGAADMDEDLVLNWPDGSKDVIHYHCSDHREGRTPKCNRSWKLNGNKHEGNTFRFSGKLKRA